MIHRILGLGFFLLLAFAMWVGRLLFFLSVFFGATISLGWVDASPWVALLSAAVGLFGWVGLPALCYILTPSHAG